MNRVDLDKVPVGNGPPAAAEFPLPSLRQFLTPDQTVQVKTFTSGSVNQGGGNLDEQINRWVYETKNIIATVSPLAQTPSGYSLSVTYVQAAGSARNV